MMARLLLTALLLLPAGCGHKGPVRPLGVPQPAAVRQLAVGQFGDSLVVTWRAPKSNQDGSPLANLQRFDIYRQTFDPHDDCPECRQPKTPMARVPAEANRAGFSFIDRTALIPGRGYRYRVIAVSGDNLPGRPAQAKAVFVEPPQPPTRLKGQALEKLCRLSWLAPAGALPDGYRIEKGTQDTSSLFDVLAELPAEQTGYDDFAVTGGGVYRYRVRARYRTDTGTVYSTATPVVVLEARP